MKKKKALSLLFTLCLTTSLLHTSVIAEDDSYGIEYADDSYGSESIDGSESESTNNENSENSSEDSESSDDSYGESEEWDSGESYHEISYVDNSQRQTTPTPSLTDLLPQTDTFDIDTSIGVTTDTIQGWPQGIDIFAPTGVLLEDSTNTILYAKSMNVPVQPASTVKLMTCLLALEKGNLSDTVIVTATGVSGIIDGGPNVSIQEGEAFTLEQCLNAMILSSANDMALQVAEHIGGSVENFVQMMNDRAKELGCTNTVFTNPTGTPDPNMHVTAHDMALIVQAGIHNEDFCRITSTLSYTIPPTNVSGGERVLTSSFPMINPGSDGYFDGCISGKSGFMESSGDTIACAAKRNDETLICVLYGGPVDTGVIDASGLLTYGYNMFSYLDLAANDFSIISGGKVIVPTGTTADQLSSQDSLTSDGQIARTYTFNGAKVGTAIADLSSDGDTGIDTSGTEHMKEAREYTSNKSMVPYAVIGGVGLLLIILLIIRIVMIARSK